jgi:hypothetical protein
LCTSAVEAPVPDQRTLVDHGGSQPGIISYLSVLHWPSVTRCIPIKTRVAIAFVTTLSVPRPLDQR